jgi:pantoate--beta-alanine ligase
MRKVRTVAELRSAVAERRRSGDSIGFVPTMGAFHEGHLSLMGRARSECGFVVVSLFVNPLQFNAGEDFDRYPRDEERDAALASSAGTDLLFAPPAEEVYRPGYATRVTVGEVGDRLCGASRPGHFDGIATVFAKLFNMVAADVVYLGQKDAQQALIAQRLVRDLDMTCRVEVCATVRDADGLALSSRNAYLAPEDRARAVALSRAMNAAELAVGEGERDAAEIARIARRTLSGFDVEPEYLELVDPQTLTPVDRVDGETLVAVAARVGPARLIDNTVLRPDG